MGRWDRDPIASIGRSAGAGRRYRPFSTLPSEALSREYEEHDHDVTGDAHARQQEDDPGRGLGVLVADHDSLVAAVGLVLVHDEVAGAGNAAGHGVSARAEAHGRSVGRLRRQYRSTRLSLYR